MFGSALTLTWQLAFLPSERVIVMVAVPAETPRITTVAEAVLPEISASFDSITATDSLLLLHVISPFWRVSALGMLARSMEVLSVYTVKLSSDRKVISPTGSGLPPTFFQYI